MKNKRIIYIITAIIGIAAAVVSISTHRLQAQEIPAASDTAISSNTNQAASANPDDQMMTTEGPKRFSLWELFRQGGAFMWPILAIFAVGIAFMVERYIFFAKAKLGSKEFIDMIEKQIHDDSLETVEETCRKHNNKVAYIISKGLKLKSLGYERVEKTLTVAASNEVAALERGLGIIAAIGNIAPTLGFLGTVTGMITAFNDIAAADQVSAKIVAGGIKEALLTTAFGLIVAIPTLLVYNQFTHRIEGFTSDVERLGADIVEKLIIGNEKIQ